MNICGVLKLTFYQRFTPESMLRHGRKLLYMLQESEPCLDNSETSLLGWWSTLLGGHCFAVTNPSLAHCKTIQIKFSAADIMYIVQAVIVLLLITSPLQTAKQ